MTSPDWLLKNILGRRTPTDPPNVADKSSGQSTSISEAMLEILSLSENIVGAKTGQTAGVELERAVKAHILEELQTTRPDRSWLIDQPGRDISHFDQYAHLAEVDRLIAEDQTNVLALVIGRDYAVAPDITIGEQCDHLLLPLLHAVVSCKHTVRSDRVQNIRLEALMLTRHRRGRLPHIVVVTAEPMPTRLAALCRGTGEIDGVYHLAFNALIEAVESVGNLEQQDTLEEIRGQRRLLDFGDLARTLAT